MTNKELHWNEDERTGRGYWMALEDMTDKAIREDHDRKNCPTCNPK